MAYIDKYQQNLSIVSFPFENVNKKPIFSAFPGKTKEEWNYDIRLEPGSDY
jgi:hypothetical protein